MDLSIITRYPRFLQNQSAESGRHSVAITSQRRSIVPQPHLDQSLNAPAIPIPGNGRKPPATVC